MHEALPGSYISYSTRDPLLHGPYFSTGGLVWSVNYYRRTCMVWSVASYFSTGGLVWSGLVWSGLVWSVMHYIGACMHAWPGLVSL